MTTPEDQMSRPGDGLYRNPFNGAFIDREQAVKACEELLKQLGWKAMIPADVVVMSMPSVI